MDFQEKLLIVMYAAIAVFVVMEFFDLWNLAIVFLGILVISIIQKMSSERKIRSVNTDRTMVIDAISGRIDAFSGSIESLRSDFSRSIEFLDNKINVVNEIYESEMRKGYNEISLKIAAFEEKLDAIRQTLENICNESDKDEHDNGVIDS